MGFASASSSIRSPSSPRENWNRMWRVADIVGVDIEGMSEGRIKDHWDALSTFGEDPDFQEHHRQMDGSR